MTTILDKERKELKYEKAFFGKDYGIVLRKRDDDAHVLFDIIWSESRSEDVWKVISSAYWMEGLTEVLTKALTWIKGHCIEEEKGSRGWRFSDIPEIITPRMIE